jgi:hypothetical protein
MQELYYASASASLTLLKEDKTITNFTVTNLIVCSSLYEIIAFTGSTQLVSFPIGNTNLYYNDNIPPLTNPTSSIFSQYASLLWSIQFVQNQSSNAVMSGSGGFIYSGSNYYVSQSNGISDNGAITLATGSTYTASIGSNIVDSYTTYLYLYDLSVSDPIYPGSVIAIVSGSGTTISASFAPSGSHTYQAILTFIGKT